MLLAEPEFDKDHTGVKLKIKLLMDVTVRTRAYPGIHKFVYQDHVPPGLLVIGQRCIIEINQYTHSKIIRVNKLDPKNLSFSL